MASVRWVDRDETQIEQRVDVRTQQKSTLRVVCRVALVRARCAPPPGIPPHHIPLRACVEKAE